MSLETEHEFDTISIKLTDNQIPSLNLIKGSQDHISLTFSVSISNLSENNISIKSIPK